MAYLGSITRLALLTLAVGTSLMAQDPWTVGFKMGGGPTLGSVKGLMGDAGFNMGAAIEVGYRLDKSSSFVFDAGYRFYPGDYKTLSFIPSATGIAAGTYEARVRKPDAKGIELTAMYRKDLNEDFYVQTGVRIGFTRLIITDTGSTVVYTAAATPTTTGAVTSVTTIASIKEKKTTSIGLIGGLGFHINSTYSVEANAYTLRMSSPLGETKSGIATEFTFGIRF